MSERAASFPSNPHPQPLSLCAGRGEPSGAREASIWRAEARTDVQSAELASDVAAKSPSPCAQGEGLGVRVLQPQPSLSPEVSDAAGVGRAPSSPAVWASPPRRAADRGVCRPGSRWRSPSGGILSGVEGPRAPDQRGTRWHPHTGVIPSAVEGSCPSPRWYGVSSPHRCRPERSRRTSRPRPRCCENAAHHHVSSRAQSRDLAPDQCGTLPAPERGRRSRSHAAGERDPSTSLRMTPAGGRRFRSNAAGDAELRRSRSGGHPGAGRDAPSPQPVARKTSAAGRGSGRAAGPGGDRAGRREEEEKTEEEQGQAANHHAAGHHAKAGGQGRCRLPPHRGHQCEPGAAGPDVPRHPLGQVDQRVRLPRREPAGRRSRRRNKDAAAIAPRRPAKGKARPA